MSAGRENHRLSVHNWQERLQVSVACVKLLALSAEIAGVGIGKNMISERMVRSHCEQF